MRQKESDFHTLYNDELSLKDKIRTIAQEIYGAHDVKYEPAAEKQLAKIESMGFGFFPDLYGKEPVFSVR